MGRGHDVPESGGVLYLLGALGEEASVEAREPRAWTREEVDRQWIKYAAVVSVGIRRMYILCVQVAVALAIVIASFLFLMRRPTRHLIMGDYFIAAAIALNVGAALAFVHDGNWPQVAYWAACAAVQGAVLWGNFHG